MKRRLLVGTAVSLFVGLVLAFGLAMPMVENIHRQEVRQRLDTVLTLLDETGAASAAGSERLRQLANGLGAEGEQVRITRIDGQGNVLADSQAQGLSIENHLERPEVQQALREGKGYDMRTSETVGSQLYYAAIRTQSGEVLRAALSMNVLEGIRWQLAFCALVGMLAGGFVGMLLCAFTRSRILRPVLELTQAATAMAGGDYTHRVVPDDDELGDMAKAFNTMAYQLDVTHRELSDKQRQLEAVLEGMDDGVLAVDRHGLTLFFNSRAGQLLGDAQLTQGAAFREGVDAGRLRAAMERVLTGGEASRLEVTLAGPQERILSCYVAPLAATGGLGALAVLTDITRMAQLERMRSDFVANVSHELKTPLTSIRGYVELLKQDDADEQTRHSCYDILEIESERLAALITDLLNLSEIEQGKEEAPQACSVNAVAEEVLTRVEPLAERQQVTLINRLPPSLTLCANPERIRQLLTNLVDNAIKYNKPGGSVTLEGHEDRGVLTLMVKDTGIGIPPEHIPRLFERFYRVDKGRSRALGGTGLGLSIVKHIAQLYGGEVRVSSRVNEGSVFVARFARAKGE